MTTTVLAAEGGIQPGAHTTVELLGVTLNIDTILATVFAGAVVCGVGLYMARGATKGRPSKLQLVFEALTGWVQGQVREGMGLRAPRGVVALSVALFAFILVSNLVTQIPGHAVGVLPPTADVNLVYPMALLVIIWVNVAGIRRRGARAYFGHLKEPYLALAPIEVITQYIARPASLALRLWGNIFAGGIMISLIALMPAYILWAPTAVWKSFELFIGLLQALIFTLLTIIYFSEAVGNEEGAAH
ncbi:F0F1 ATP synthase subunit A [Pseudonocardia sp.]|uniref:F0F1 ATP synthase subunit A n=1 Tax=Pseudonocardia sp. TaxID=60912 RepID=UPI0026333FBD|nr:F0F1 ATP synthase subunit A [Pseudonocardia sp.]